MTDTPSANIAVPVLIVGAGPVGVTVANLLGTYGVETLLIDRSPEILNYPRAVGLDDEALRTFQSCGLAELMLRDMIQNVPMRLYTADRQCCAEILPRTREYGWFRRNLFSQPLGETTLRNGLKRFPHVTLQPGVELETLAQTDAGVTATLRDADGGRRTIRADYLVASDGARSTVRELLKVPYLGQTHPHKWAVIECDADPLDAPYTALHCEPRRPYVCLRLPYGLRRWEFMMFPGEDDAQILAPDKVRELLRGHVADPDRLNIVRARVYTHNSRVAESFVVGRVCLAGDTAHITPPWIGQGLNAGLRDAYNLAWKLAWILQGRLKPELLQSYHDERHAHAKAMIDLADQFGAVLSMRNPALAWLRDRFLMAIRRLPPVRDYVLQMRFKPMPRFAKGVVVNSGDPARDALVGRMFIQPNVETADGGVRKLDDLVGSRFALIGWRCDPLASAPAELLAQLERLGCDRYFGVRSRCGDGESGLPAGPSPAMSSATTNAVTVLQDVDNDLQAWFGPQGIDWVLIRPDRFVAAAGRRDDAAGQLSRFCTMALPDSEAPSAAASTVPRFPQPQATVTAAAVR
ncbi:bifunctional 3-(3-hydroxy-phenyl)propionate/3-hydroxycinnamic acid hydroxylase [Azospirillum sp. Sh1]|uniref:bifunctional 3-(3-hydroxy-phenyl)propionate/3-hydroxycinnamic acid hydroxylase n=1 Tax=Azospirillum sp. Sh1 TaxID=2607285 RepID=UPI0011EE63F4|nr:bifunctional 3-(3-hydroxy-phenyl)propionate/3-hydroxycinnamic acid hydroxylase [Azospirillum sp. Sh1]KAA0570223.1 bifunctional 3-(3-hydroxy-phenyl)propionate/3-hydroxycinnamic acid hydroxylase [Azospirillum sp. Sh1]